MSEGGLSEDHVEGLRREIGEKMARDNEGTPIESASESLKAGYRRAAMGFGSNVNPRNFGKGGAAPQDWTCICGNVNRGDRRLRIGGRIVCWLCRVEKDVAMRAQG